MHSTELVPLSYAREAYNNFHGTELVAHDDAVTPEQSAYINRHYNVEIWTGVHGVPGVSTESEYEQVAVLVNGLGPDDTLFTENRGFGKLSPAVGHAVQDSWEKLAEDRATARIDVWTYARRLAELRGVRVVDADSDAFEVEAAEALAGKTFSELSRSSDSHDQLLAKEFVRRQRELKARNTVKDFALSRRPEAPTESRKPKLALLFGGAHEQDLEKAFADMGIQTRTVSMKGSAMDTRVGEALGRTIGEIAKQLAKDLIDP